MCTWSWLKYLPVCSSTAGHVHAVHTCTQQCACPAQCLSTCVQHVHALQCLSTCVQHVHALQYLKRSTAKDMYTHLYIASTCAQACTHCTIEHAVFAFTMGWQPPLEVDKHDGGLPLLEVNTLRTPSISISVATPQ